MNLRSIIAADGLPRRLFTVADVERMVEVGLIGEDERIELLEGELIPMSPQGNRHEVMKSALLEHFFAVRPPDIRIGVETTLRLSDETFLIPDALVFPKSVGFKGLTAANVLLAIEVATTSLNYDLGRKARVYADFGVAELWVIDVEAKVVHVHRRPGPDGYADVARRRGDELVTPERAPAFAVRLADLDLAD